MYAAVDNRGVSSCFKNAWFPKWHNRKVMLRDCMRAKLAMLPGLDTDLWLENRQTGDKNGINSKESIYDCLSI